MLSFLILRSSFVIHLLPFQKFSALCIYLLWHSWGSRLTFSGFWLLCLLFFPWKLDNQTDFDLCFQSFCQTLQAVSLRMIYTTFTRRTRLENNQEMIVPGNSVLILQHQDSTCVEQLRLLKAQHGKVRYTLIWFVSISKCIMEGITESDIRAVQ